MPSLKGIPLLKISQTPQNHSEQQRSSEIKPIPRTNSTTREPTLRAPHNSLYGNNSLYGGKFDGLQTLTSLTAATDIQVPDFIGIHKNDIDTILQQERLTPAIDAFLKPYQNTPNARFMIRSSSGLEDQAGQSAAGSFETVSNVANIPAAFIGAIHKVNRSFVSARARTQSELYQTNQKTDKRNGIVIQLMIGETPGDENTIPVSGVGLSPDAYSHAPGTFNISSTFGHGEGVVQGLVPTDETVGIISPSGIHARSQIAVKHARLAPKDDFHGLDVKNNTAGTKHQPSLNQASIHSYGTLLDKIARHHPTGADLEFVATAQDSFAVQQRSQDVISTIQKPCYLKNSFIDNNQHQLFKVRVKSSSHFGVSTLTGAQRLVAESLDDAFYNQYLQIQSKGKASAATQIQAVFVKPPANPNSHAALMFRQQGIAIVEVENATVFHALNKMDTPFILDQQRGLVFQDMKLKQSDYTPGLLQYPCEPVYSVPDEKTPLSDQQMQLLKILLQTSVSSKIQKLEHHELMNTLKQKVLSDSPEDKPQARQCISQLLRGVHDQLQQAQRRHDEQLHHIACEIVVDLLRLAASIDADQPVLHQLLYLNWIEAALHQMPEQHPHLTGLASIQSQLREYKTNQSFVRWFSAMKVHNAGEQIRPARDLSQISRDCKVAIQILHRLSYGLNLPQLKTKWFKSISEWSRDGSLPEKTLIALAQKCIQALKNGQFEAMLGDIMLNNNDSLNIAQILQAHHEPVPELEKLKLFNTQLGLMSNAWSSPEGFAQRLSCIQMARQDFANAVKTIKASQPFSAIVMLKQLDNTLEQIDLALKTIVSAPVYNNKKRIEDFRRLLNEFHRLTQPLLTAAFQNIRKYNWELSKFNTKFHDIFTTPNSSLAPTAQFNVSESLITRSVNQNYTSDPISLGDFHTLLHQNLRASMGTITLNIGAEKCLPQQAQTLHTSLMQPFSDEKGKKKSLILTSMKLTDQDTSWQYVLPLRDHGVRVHIQLDTKKQGMTVAIAMDGDSENKRYDIAIDIIQKARQAVYSLPDSGKSILTGKAAWPDPNTASNYVLSWEESGRTADIKTIGERIHAVLRQIIDISYAFSEGTFDDSHENINRTNRLFKIMPKFEKCLQEQNLEGAAKLLHSHLSPSHLHFWRSSNIPLENKMSLTELKNVMQESGLIDNKISLYEFDSLLNQKPVVH